MLPAVSTDDATAVPPAAEAAAESPPPNQVNEQREKLLQEAAAQAAVRAALPSLDGLRAGPQHQTTQAGFLTVLGELIRGAQPLTQFLNQHLQAAGAEQEADPLAAVNHMAVMQKLARQRPDMAARTMLLAVYLASGSALVQITGPTAEELQALRSQACPHVYGDLRCAHPHPHTGAHRSAAGVEWDDPVSEPPPAGETPAAPAEPAPPPA